MSNEFCKEEYTRLDFQVNYYNHEWHKHRNRYRIIQYILIGVTALIPIFNSGQLTLPHLNIIVTILGSGAVAVTALNQLLKYQESWPVLKLTWALLDREHKLYGGRAGDYSLDDDKVNCQRLVENVERIILNQRQGYAETHQK